METLPGGCAAIRVDALIPIGIQWLGPEKSYIHGFGLHYPWLHAPSVLYRRRLRECPAVARDDAPMYVGREPPAVRLRHRRAEIDRRPDPLRGPWVEGAV